MNKKYIRKSEPYDRFPRAWINDMKTSMTEAELEEVNGRRTGRTLACAMELVALAMLEPNVPHLITARSGIMTERRAAADYADDVISRLNLKGFDIYGDENNQYNFYIEYKLVSL